MAGSELNLAAYKWDCDILAHFQTVRFSHLGLTTCNSRGAYCTISAGVEEIQCVKTCHSRNAEAII